MKQSKLFTLNLTLNCALVYQLTITLERVSMKHVAYAKEVVILRHQIYLRTEQMQSSNLCNLRKMQVLLLVNPFSAMKMVLWREEQMAVFMHSLMMAEY